jgi:tRNA (guanosine-2'-O-)-methyltransferase
MLSDFDISKPSAIFFGTETNGLSAEIIDQADEFIKIPMSGFTESLNISVSAAIILQDITQKLRSSNLNWELTENEKNAIKFEWLSKSFKSFDQLVEKFQDNG